MNPRRDIHGIPISELPDCLLIGGWEGVTQSDGVEISDAMIGMAKSYGAVEPVKKGMGVGVFTATVALEIGARAALTGGCR